MSDMVLTLTINAEALKKGVVEVQGKLSELSNQKVGLNTAEAESKLKSLRDSVAMWGLAIRGAVDTFQMIGKGVSNFLNPAMEAEQAQMDLGAALRNTGLEVDGTTAALAKHAKELQSLTKYEDDAIISATALMQNIGHLGAEQLPDAQKAAIGLASAYRINLETAFELVGKAAAGSTAMMGKYGIVLDQSLSPQEKFSQVLKIGAEKFAIATQEVNTASGRWEQFKNQVGDLVESLGQMLLPVLTDLIKLVQPIVQWFTSLSAPMKVILLILPAMTVGWYKLVAAQVTYAAVTATLSGAVTAAAAAIRTFFITLGPVGMAMGVLSLAIAALTVNTQDSADATFDLINSYEPLSQRMANVSTEATREKMVFDQLAKTLLDLKGKTNQTAGDKELMAATIKDLNENYGEYLGNIDMETSSYNSLANALDRASSAILSNAIAKATGKIYEDQLETIIKIQQQMRQLPANMKPLQSSVGGQFGANAKSALGVDLSSLMAPSDANDPKYYKWNILNDQLRRATEDLKLITNDYKTALAGVSAVTVSTPGGATTSGATASASTGKTDAEKAKQAYDALLAELDNYHAGERMRIQRQAEEKEKIILAGTDKDSQAQKDALKLLDDWKTEEWKKIDRSEADARTAAIQALLDKQAAYYEEVKFKDSGYFTWKTKQIDDEVKAMGLSADHTKLLVGEKIALLMNEKAAWEALPLASVLEKYKAWKAEAADGREVGIQAWKRTLDGLQQFKAALEQLDPTIPGVKEAIAQIVSEIEVAQMQVQKKGNWFWSGLLGFDPDSATDQEKINKIKKTTSTMAQQAVSFSQNMITLAYQRRDAELAALDKRAQAEKWSDAETIKRKDAVTKKYAEEAKKIGRIQQAVSIAQATINTAESAVAAYKAMAAIPVVGPALGAIAAATALAAGAVQIAVIRAQKFARGGQFNGIGGPTDDRNLVLLSNGEYVVNAASTAKNKPVLDAINGTPGSGFDMRGIERRLDALNMNVAALELSVNITNRAPDIKTQVEKHERAKARQIDAGRTYEYGSI